MSTRKQKAKAPRTITAYCWQSGLIGFGHRVPKGALVFAKGPEKKLREVVEVRARWSYPSKPGAGDEKLLVPGIPETLDPNVKLDALFKFRAWVKKGLAR